MERTKISDPGVMRALAHPARLEILNHLSQSNEGVTATECAELVGLSPSATSYHLRALAKVGMIQEGPSRGDGRERVWQAMHDHYAVSADRVASAEELAAESALVEAFLARQNDKVRQSLATIRQENNEWFDVATITDQHLVMTPDELKSVLERIEEVIDPYKRQVRREPPAGSHGVTLQIRAFPS